MEESEALTLLKMCKTLARRLSFEGEPASIKLTLGDLTSLRGFSQVLRLVTLSRKSYLMQESGLTEVDQLSLIRMLEVIINREKIGVNVATGKAASRRHKIGVSHTLANK